MRGWATAERARLEARINGAHAVRCMNPVEVYMAQSWDPPGDGHCSPAPPAVGWVGWLWVGVIDFDEGRSLC